MTYRWSIEPTDYASISQDGLVTFEGHYSGIYTATCRDESNHCGQFIITREGPGCEQPPQPKGLKITLTVTENDTMRGYALSDADLMYNGGEDGYRVHRSTDGTSEEVITTNVSVVASKLGVAKPTEFYPDPYTAGAYYGCPGGGSKWTVYNGDNIDNNLLKSFFEGAWKCTAENENWKAAEHQPCKGTYATDVFTVEIINKSNTYNLPYNGRIKLNIKNSTSGINLYYRNCSNTDSHPQKWPHFYYGKNNEDGQCTNFIVRHGESVTLKCKADASVAGLTASMVESVEIYAAIINNSPEHNQELECYGHASYLQGRGFKLGDVSVSITRA